MVWFSSSLQGMENEWMLDCVPPEPSCFPYFLPRLTETKLMNIVKGLKKYVLPGNISDLCHRFKGSASIP